MNSFDPHAYGPTFAPLLAGNRRRALDGGRPDKSAHSALAKLSVDEALAHAPVNGKERIADRDMAACCLAGIWLLYDFLDESHTISQGINTPSGSFWHAIMHRREGDFSNAKYWFRHTADHPTLETVGQRVADLAGLRGADQEIKRLTSGGTWDTFAFVDLCQAVAREKSNSTDICLDIQQIEWESLFDHCYRAAIGE